MAVKSRALGIEPTTMNIYHIEFGIQRLENHCSNDQLYLTNCIEEKYDKLFGNTYQDMVLRLINQTRISYDGHESIYQLTGCKRPCKSFTFELNEIVKFNNQNSRETSTSKYKALFTFEF